jgi:hypothetical protein
MLLCEDFRLRNRGDVDIFRVTLVLFLFTKRIELNTNHQRSSKSNQSSINLCDRKSQIVVLKTSCYHLFLL